MVTEYDKALPHIVSRDRPGTLERLVAEGVVTPPPDRERAPLRRRFTSTTPASPLDHRRPAVIAYFDMSAIMRLLIDEPLSDLTPPPRVAYGRDLPTHGRSRCPQPGLTVQLEHPGRRYRCGQAPAAV